MALSIDGSVVSKERPCLVGCVEEGEAEKRERK